MVMLVASGPSEGAVRHGAECHEEAPGTARDEDGKICHEYYPIQVMPERNNEHHKT